MGNVNIQEAKTHLSRLLTRVEAGESVTISRAGVPIATLVPAAPVPPRSFGQMEFTLPDDFDEPLSGEDLAAWE